MTDESSLPTVLRKILPPNLEKIRSGHYSKDDPDYLIHRYLKKDDITVDETGSKVIDFLRNKSILVTGATGFFGKLLVEKLLRCCKDIDTIYIIVRSKKGKDIETRIKEYLDNWVYMALENYIYTEEHKHLRFTLKRDNHITKFVDGCAWSKSKYEEDPVFVKLSEIHPNFRDKVVGFSGDFEEDGLGLSEESRSILTEKVNIIYHAAASIRFDEKLKKAVKVNLKGTLEVIKLAKECKNFDVLSHISTAYSNCRFKEIKEQFYPPLMDPKKLIKITDALSSEVVDRITPGLLGDCPNTYIFTKQITEDLLKTESVGLPTCIQRPSIVVASVREPVRSWIDNIYGPVGIIIGSAKGLIHVMCGDHNGRCDWVPADYVVNNCIAASYKTAKDRLIDKVQVFNFSCSGSNPLYWKALYQCAYKNSGVGTTQMLTRPFFQFTKCRYWYIFLNFILHTIPGIVLDFIAVKLGKEPQLGKIYSKIDKSLAILTYFTLNEWTFDSSNTEKLWNSLNDKDKRIFPFNMQTLNWDDYFETYLVAIREFVVFEFWDNIEEGKRYRKRLFLICDTAIITTLVMSTYFLFNTVLCFIPITLISITLSYVIFGAY